MKRRMLVLEPGSSGERRMVLQEERCTIGRSRRADVQIDNAGVSALHASVVVHNDRAELLDLDSTNGTRVNGEPVTRTPLRDGDLILVAECALLYREETVGSEDEKGTVTLTPAPDSLSQAVRCLGAAAVEGGTCPEAQVDAIVARVGLLEHGSRLFDALHRLVNGARGQGERSEVITLLLAELGSVLEVDSIGVYTVDDALFYLLGENGLTTEPCGEGVSRSVLDSVIAGGHAVVIEQVGEDSGVVGFKSLMRFRVGSVLALPVKGVRGGVEAVLYGVSNRLERLRLLEQERNFLEACAATVSLVLENRALLQKQREQGRCEERAASRRRFAPVISRLNEQRENLSLKLGSDAESPLFGLDRKENRIVREFVDKACRVDLPVLLTGETGTGKSVLAACIHRRSMCTGPLVTIDCTTLAGELLESELFGHEKGAFTGAFARKEGKVSRAQGGTLFLDEVGELPLHLQVKLLRLLQSGEYEPVGGTQTCRVTVRLICATNRKLVQEVANRTFREDLYFRLGVLQLEMPPLRTLTPLIEPMARWFLQRYAPRLAPTVGGLSPSALSTLLRHPWPGNIRELENTMMRGLVNASGEEICADDLGLAPVVHPQISGEENPVPDAGFPPRIMDLKKAREELDRRLITHALRESDHTVARAARLLSISRNSLMDLIRKYGL